MQATPTDLYRFGPTPRLDRVRIDPNPITKSKDAVSFDVDLGNGVTETWVRGGMKGVSCFAVPNNRLTGRGKWWRLPQGTIYDDTVLFLYTGDGAHWSWVPVRDMKLSDGNAPDFVEVSEAGIAVDPVMRLQRAVQRSW